MRKRPSARLITLIVLVAALVAVFALGYLTPVCCVPEPLHGQFYLQSYNFQVSGGSASLSADFGVATFGQNVTVSEVFLDQTMLNSSNSNLTSSCGLKSYGAWYGYDCTLKISFGPSVGPLPAESKHTLKVVASTGVSSVFQVTAGEQYPAPGTYPVVTVGGSVFQGCVGSQPLSVTFSNESGAAVTTGVTSTAGGWGYSVQLLNGHAYTVTVSYKPVTPNASTQTASGGSLDLSIASPTYTYNIRC
jgi:hypothetical protein